MSARSATVRVRHWAGLVLALVVITPAWAESAPAPGRDSEGWSLSRGAVVDDPQDGSFVRLDLQLARGTASLGRTAPLEPGRDYALRIEYRSNVTDSVRNKGSWIYASFRDAKNTAIGDQCLLLAPAAAWKTEVFPLKPAAGASKIILNFRQQQRVGTLDLRSVELKRTDVDATDAVTLTPAAKVALAWILTPGEKLSPSGERSPLEGNIFQPWLAGKAPPIAGEAQDVFAVIARPPGGGSLPAVLWLHGGYGCAQAGEAVRYAKAGYVALSPDLPGIGDPKKCPDSTGPWKPRFPNLGWTVQPDPTANETFDAVVAALGAFDLLAAQPGVNQERIGISGISMGGYTTTMISGLLGKRVRVAYAKFGCGFYDRGSTWMNGLAELPDQQREGWLRHFDAGRRASGITAPYFIAAAVRDHFFWPPAVNATVSAIPAGANQAYAPVVTHRLTGIPGDDTIDLLYLAYWLKGEGQPFPTVAIEGCEAQADGGRRITFSVQAPLPVQTATLYVTAGGDSWEASTWEGIAAQPAGDKRFAAVIPAGSVAKRGAWYVNVSDARPATAGSLVYGMDAAGTPAISSMVVTTTMPDCT